MKKGGDEDIISQRSDKPVVTRHYDGPAMKFNGVGQNPENRGTQS
jgi:hypothetical protein